MQMQKESYILFAETVEVMDDLHGDFIADNC
jgi:hypothetical protein